MREEGRMKRKWAGVATVLPPVSLRPIISLRTCVSSIDPQLRFDLEAVGKSFGIRSVVKKFITQLLKFFSFLL